MIYALCILVTFSMASPNRHFGYLNSFHIFELLL